MDAPSPSPTTRRIDTSMRAIKNYMFFEAFIQSLKFELD